MRGRLTALDAKTGKILWRWYTLPAPGDVGGDSWPAGTDHYMHGGATIWNTPALDPQLGLVYFSIGNCGPDYDGSMREGDNLFCASVVALNAKTGQYAWHFQEVHHDIWDYDAASPAVLFDTVINGQPRKGIAQAGRTGWVYILDRTNGKPLVGIEEKPVPQEPRQKTAKTQPYPVGDATVPQCAQPMEGYEKAGCIFEAFWEEPTLVQPSGIGGTNWSPMSYNPDTGFFYVPGTVRTSAFARYGDKYKKGLQYNGGTQAAPIGSAMSGTWTAIGGNTNKIAWQKNVPFRVGSGGGSTTTAGGLVFHGDPERHNPGPRCKDRRSALAVPDRLRRGGNADGLRGRWGAVHRHRSRGQSGGRQRQWRCGVDLLAEGAVEPAVATATAADRRRTHRRPDCRQCRHGQDRRRNNIEFGYFPRRDRIKAGTTVTFTNAGDTPHTATSFENGKIGDWDTGPLNSGQSKAITFDKPGNYYYICTPHPWMYGQIIVE